MRISPVLKRLLHALEVLGVASCQIAHGGAQLDDARGHLEWVRKSVRDDARRGRGRRRRRRVGV